MLYNVCTPRMKTEQFGRKMAAFRQVRYISWKCYFQSTSFRHSMCCLGRENYFDWTGPGSEYGMKVLEVRNWIWSGGLRGASEKSRSIPPHFGTRKLSFNPPLRLQGYIFRYQIAYFVPGMMSRLQFIFVKEWSRLQDQRKLGPCKLDFPHCCAQWSLLAPQEPINAA